MHGMVLKDARLALRLTQNDAASALGITQAYLSMVECGKRPVSAELACRGILLFSLPSTALPLGEFHSTGRDELEFKQGLGALGYPGFAHLCWGVDSETLRERLVNPAELLMDALDSEDLDTRVVEALPWLCFVFPEMNWDWLIRHAKARDRQNRLAFVMDLARQIAEKKGDAGRAALLAARIKVLERSRLSVEDTLCEASITRAERKWLETHRPEPAHHWNILSDLIVEHIDYAAY